MIRLALSAIALGFAQDFGFDNPAQLGKPDADEWFVGIVAAQLVGLELEDQAVAVEMPVVAGAERAVMQVFADLFVCHRVAVVAAGFHGAYPRLFLQTVQPRQPPFDNNIAQPKRFACAAVDHVVIQPPVVVHGVAGKVAAGMANNGVVRGFAIQRGAAVEILHAFGVVRVGIFAQPCANAAAVQRGNFPNFFKEIVCPAVELGVVGIQAFQRYFLARVLVEAA